MPTQEELNAIYDAIAQTVRQVPAATIWATSTNTPANMEAVASQDQASQSAVGDSDPLVQAESIVDATQIVAGEALTFTNVDYTVSSLEVGSPFDQKFVEGNSYYSCIAGRCRVLRKYPESPEAEIFVNDLIQHIGARARGNQSVPPYTEMNYATGRVQAWLLRFTGVKWERPYNQNNMLIHPDNRVYVHTSLLDTVACSISYANNNSTRCCVCESLHFLDTVEFVHNHSYCQECYAEEGFYYCEECEEHHDAGYECDNCERREDMPIGHVYDYEHDVRRVLPNLLSLKTDKVERGNRKLYFGIELEVIPRNNIPAEQAAVAVGKAMQDLAILKYDGSLSEGGFEIVTAPATLNYHRKKDGGWDKMFNAKDSTGRVASDYVKSWNTKCCGLHIHFTRAALNSMQFNKVLVFFHEDKNSRFLTDMAGREVSRMANWCKQSKKRLGKSTPEQCNNHYEAITISHRNNGRTAEVRIFRGNATQHGIYRALELVASIIEWCGQNSATNLSYKAFLHWFDKPSNRASYPDLWRHLVDQGYLGTQHKTRGTRITKEAADAA